MGGGSGRVRRWKGLGWRDNFREVHTCRVGSGKGLK